MFRNNQCTRIFCWLHGLLQSSPLLKNPCHFCFLLEPCSQMLQLNIRSWNFERTIQLILSFFDLSNRKLSQRLDSLWSTVLSVINIFPAPMCPKSAALLPDLRPSGSLTWVQFQLCSVSFHRIRRQWTVIGEKSCLMKTVLVKLFCIADHNPANCRILCSAIQKSVFL